ncbi:hypothetical protein Q9R20_03400 [Microbacterium sp. PRF11]|uniref:hypothetical protein n=1 Tax=Microbacterium sp. PRF11 TaxID=2962593 RepID=UPI0028821596|nr:hypothetical protein [Microbacterium sp. PRF11]MDT0116026.1 hypothetical protein [Microbacterium sp. PRF11]
MTEPHDDDDVTRDDSLDPGASRSGSDSPLDDLLRSAEAGDDLHAVFPIGFRGYDRDAVDAAVRELGERVRRATADVEEAKRRAEAMFAQQRAEHDEELEEAARRHAEENGSLQEQLREASARAAEAETQVSALSNDFAARRGDDADPQQDRQQFDAILRVAEEQASVLVQNAVAQADRLLAAAQDEAAAVREEAVAEQARLRSEAQHDADQVRLRIETESTAHAAASSARPPTRPNGSRRRHAKPTRSARRPRRAQRRCARWCRARPASCGRRRSATYAR